MVAETLFEVCHNGFTLISHAGGLRKMSYKDYPAANKAIDDPASPASNNLQRYAAGFHFTDVCVALLPQLLVKSLWTGLRLLLPPACLTNTEHFANTSYLEITVPTTIVFIIRLCIFHIIMADVLFVSLLLTSLHRSHTSEYPAANRPPVTHTAPTASDSPQHECLTGPVLENPSVGPSSTLTNPSQVALNASDEVLDEVQNDPDPPDYSTNYSRYEPILEKRHPVQPNRDPEPTPVGPPIKNVAENISPPTPPVLPQTRLRRGLQVPSRISHITWGFRLPLALVDVGVGKEQWKTFTHEIKRHARMTKSQFFLNLFTSWGLGFCCNLIIPISGPIISGVYSHKEQKRKEHENFNIAHASGALQKLADRWNTNYFENLGLQVRVEPPDAVQDDMKEMDIASTRLFKYQQKRGYSSPAAGEDSGLGDAKEIKYMTKEGRERMKATMKCRIIIVPFVSGANGTVVLMRRVRTMETPATHADEGLSPSPSRLALQQRKTSVF
ncbi:hypothetical protein N7G274_008549 [Stereocaulon virgatum]|uniref:Uncharacterized protein n=1 Tax=Stereocaulon virgatum TaxID=373712 RepID=A0ABR4A1D0_9LECA